MRGNEGRVGGFCTFYRQISMKCVRAKNSALLRRANSVYSKSVLLHYTYIYVCVCVCADIAQSV
jgi:hypothetical protein